MSGPRGPLQSGVPFRRRLTVIPEDGCSTMNADWHRASIDYAMRNVAAVTTTDEVLSALGA